MKYFGACRNQDDLKREYKLLVKENHPDKGGSTKIMQEIIKQYKKLLDNGIIVRYEEITPEDVDEHFSEVDDLMNSTYDSDFVDMEMI